MTIDISILIATRNRIESLRRQFRALAELDTEGISFEIIVVDNGSEDGTTEWLQEMSARQPVVCLSEPIPGKNRALNRGLEVARGTFILFTDDDTMPVRRWLREYHNATLRWPDEDVFCGPIEPSFPEKTPRELSDASFRYALVLFSTYLPEDPEGPIKRLPMGPNLAVRATRFQSQRFCESIGPSSDPRYTMGSETEFLQRMRQDGVQFIFLPNAKISHEIREEQLTIRWICGRAFRFGRSYVRLHNCDESAGRVFGAPRYMWRKLAVAGMKSLVRQLLRLPGRCVYAYEYHFIRGQIFEYQNATKARSSQVANQQETVTRAP